MWLDRLLTTFVFYRPPAAAIILGSLVVLFFGAGFLVVTVLEWLPPGKRAASAMTALWAIGTIAGDVVYRRHSRRALFDLDVSSVYGVIPSWVVGVGLLLFAADLSLGSQP